MRRRKYLRMLAIRPSGWRLLLPGDLLLSRNTAKDDVRLHVSDPDSVNKSSLSGGQAPLLPERSAFGGES